MTLSIAPASSIIGVGSSSSSSSNWIASTITAIQSEQNEGGLLGMLSNAASNDGSINSFLSQSSDTANFLATISQTSITNAGSLAAQIAASNQQQAATQKLQDSLNQATEQQQMVQPKSMLDPVIYFPDGSTIDTVNNIMTMPDGTQYDTTTGAKYVDPASIQQLGNGAYLNTSTNIMTLADGTQIDTVTGLTVSPDS
jgi:PhoPQ-activated pathogenicity-related protein